MGPHRAAVVHGHRPRAPGGHRCRGRRPPGPPRGGCARRCRGRHLRPPRGRPVRAAGLAARGRRAVPARPALRARRPAAAAGRAPRPARRRTGLARRLVVGDRLPRGVHRAVARRGRAGPRGRRPPAAELRPVAYLPRTRGPGRRRRRPRRPRAPRHLARAGVGPGHLGEQRDAAGGLRGVTGPRAARPRPGRAAGARRRPQRRPQHPGGRGRLDRGRVVPDAARVPDGGPADGPPHAGRPCLHQPRGHPDRPGALPGGGALLPRGHRVLPGARPDDVGAVPGRGAGHDPPPRRATGRRWRTSPPSPSPATARPRSTGSRSWCRSGSRGHGEGCPGRASCSRRPTRRPRPSTSPSGWCSPRPPWPRRTGCAATSTPPSGSSTTRAEVASTCSSKRPLAALLRYRVDGTHGPEAVDLPRPFAVELERSPREAATAVGRPWSGRTTPRWRSWAPTTSRTCARPWPGSSGSALPPAEAMARRKLRATGARDVPVGARASDAGAPARADRS